MVLEGVVTNVAAFGAFVDIGVHQDGLVHVSAMSRNFVSDPRQVAKPGDVVRVRVLSVDIPRKRIALSLRLDDEPGGPPGRDRRARRDQPAGRDQPRRDARRGQPRPATSPGGTGRARIRPGGTGRGRDRPRPGSAGRGISRRPAAPWPTRCAGRAWPVGRTRPGTAGAANRLATARRSTRVTAVTGDARGAGHTGSQPRPGSRRLTGSSTLSEGKLLRSV